MANRANPARQGSSTATPATYEDLARSIALRYPSLSRQLQKIARYLLEFPEQAALETVATLAGRSEVQPSSLVRFAQALGYDGFSEMQQIFRSHLVTRSGGSYRDEIERLRDERHGAEGGSARVLASFAEEGITSLQMLQSDIAPEDLDTAVATLAGANVVHLLAERRAFPVAFYLSYSLARLERPAHLLDGIGGTLTQQSRLVTADDVLLAVSFPPYSPAVVELFVQCHERNVPTVAITDSRVSPIALESNVALTIRQQEERPFRSLTAPMCLAQSLVVSLGHHLAALNNGYQFP